MTYNVLEGKNPELIAYIEKHNPDILCLQEIATAGENWEALSAKYKTTFKDVGNAANNQILSKFRILRSGEIEGLPRKNGVWADLKVKDDTVRVVNLHLQSTSIGSKDINFLEQHGYITDTAREGMLRSIVGRLMDNNANRAMQAQTVREFVNNTPYKSVVCGDFNDVPLSYTYNIIAKPFKDTFSEMASGFAYTYDTKYALLRIDNIFVSPEIEVVSYEVDNDAKYSDHYPVISRIKF
jgi:endonuclease/exonuclease/phosphatase family metal-dependent hydrolase